MPLASINAQTPAYRGKFILRTLGACTLSLDGETVRMATRKNLALIAYLAFCPSHAETRQRLAGLLWGESSEENARTSLRQAIANLSQLRTTTGEPLISVDRNIVTLNMSVLVVDLLAADEQLQRGIVADHFVNNFQFEDAFLSSIENIDPSFANWLQQRRSALRSDLIRKFSAILDRSNDPEEMMRISSAILNLDSCNEPACRAAMLASCMIGDFTGALRRYNELWSRLHSEFDTEPDRSTQELVAVIKQGRYPSILMQGRLPFLEPVETDSAPSGFAEDAPLLPGPGLRDDAFQLRLLVDDFSLFGESPGMEAKLAVLRSETLLSLTRFRELQILDGRVGLVKPACDFRVTCETFVEGANVNLILNLYRSLHGHLVWSDRLSMPESELPEGATSTANRVAAMVQHIAKAARVTEIADSAVSALDTGSRLLRVYHAEMQWNRQEEYLLRKLLLSVFAENTHIASAHAAYAASFNTAHLVFPGTFHNPKRAELVMNHAEAAMQFDPLDRRCHLSHAWALSMRGERQRAIKAFQQAVDLNMADDWTFVSAAEGLAFCGDLAASRTLFDAFQHHKAPLQEHHWAYRTTIQFLQGDFEGAAQSSRNCRLSINQSGAWGAAALALTGQRDEAQSQANRFIEQSRAEWSSDLPSTDELVGQWVLHGFPLAQHQHRKVLTEGLKRAGFKVG